MEKLLQYLNIDYKKYGEDYRSICPIHFGNNATEFKINSDGFYCFSCGEKGNIISLIMLLTDLNEEQAIEIYKDNSNYHNFINFFLQKYNNREIDFNESILKELQYHPYLQRITEKTVKIFEIGYYEGKDKRINKRILMPLRDRQQKFVCLLTRSPYIYRYKHFGSIKSYLYGLNITQFLTKNDFYITEGCFDFLKMFDHGLISSCSIISCQFSPIQLREILRLPIKNIILCLDRDEAGIRATIEWGKNLESYYNISCMIFKSKDICEALDRSETIEIINFSEYIKQYYMKA